VADHLITNHIVIGHDESGEVHIYQFATAHQANEFIRQAEGLADIGWSRYEIVLSSVRQALILVKQLEAV